MGDDFSDGYALVYAEAVRALTQQREAFESLRTRAGLVLSGAAIASSLFGGQTVAGGRLSAFGWTAVAAFAGLASALLIVLWPRPEWRGSPVPSRVIRSIEGSPSRPPLGHLQRDLALHMEAVYDQNESTYERLSTSFQIAAVLLNVEIVALVLDLASRS